jgi:hypothetical protein
MMAAPDTTSHPEVNATPARQGRWGRPVFWVLLISTVLAALALFAAWMWRADDLSTAQGGSDRDSPAARTYQAPVPAEATRQGEGSAPGDTAGRNPAY